MTTGLILKYGGTTIAGAGLSTVAIAKDAQYNARGFRTGTVETWDVEAFIKAETAAELTADIAALQTLLGTNGLDAALYLADGTTLTAHYLTSADTLGGVKVHGLYFPDPSDIYGLYRHVTFRLEAFFEAAETNLLSFSETYSVTGTTGPRFVFLPTLTGPPIKQIVQQQGTVFATQSGSAIGRTAYPTVPSPLFPTEERIESRRISRRSPEHNRGSLRGYAVEWSYEYESASAAIAGGVPNTGGTT